MTDWRARTLDVNDRTYAAWNAHDPDAVAAVFSTDAELFEAGRPEPFRGGAARRARAPRARARRRAPRRSLGNDGDPSRRVVRVGADRPPRARRGRHLLSPRRG